jgi:predicted glycogen debranching enzyme
MRPDAEWLETDGRGGFAMGPVVGPRTRRYHGLLAVSRNPPSDRIMLVNGFDAWVVTAYGRWPLSTQRYTPDVTVPPETTVAVTFTHEPWPTWTYQLPDGTTIIHELVMSNGTPAIALCWRATVSRPGITLVVRPFITGRGIHALHFENPVFDFTSQAVAGGVHWQPYASVPGIVSLSNAAYAQDPQWYRHMQYDLDRSRGYDFVEDVASPGTLTWSLSAGPAAWVLAADTDESRQWIGRARSAIALAERTRREERRRRSPMAAPLRRASDQYIVQRAPGETIIAGYPWFLDWGRDTCIGVRGLCLATGRLDVAERILAEWAQHISEGMIPNRFPESGEEPEYNSVDASLWFVVAVDELLRQSGPSREVSCARELVDAVRSIMDAYVRGTRYHIRVQGDGLLAAGDEHSQVTWMDARIDGRCLTSRAGKAVEIQALWINALRIAADLDPERSAVWLEAFERARNMFIERFWRADVGWCYDVVDVNHESGANDAKFRPNQIFAVGGLPQQLLSSIDARRLVDAVEQRLWTPMGLRTLAPDDPEYRPRYAGNQLERDMAYHQGTVWPWLAGPFIEAWVRVRGGTDRAKREARARFVEPLLARLDEGPGMGHLPEVANGDPPHEPGGAPFQAWSVAELLRITLTVV